MKNIVHRSASASASPILTALLPVLLSALLPVCLVSSLAAADHSIPPGPAVVDAAASTPDSVMARRMAAEIIEQTARSSTEFHGTLQDVAKSLRAGTMSVAQARDILSLAASSKQLMGVTTTAVSQAAAPADLDAVLGVVAATTADTAPSSSTSSTLPTLSAISQTPTEVPAASDYKPEELDIDAMLMDTPAEKKKRGLFKSQEPSVAQGANGYGAGAAGAQRSWEVKKELPPIHDGKDAVQRERENLQKSAKNLGRAQNNDLRKSLQIGTVSRALVGGDGLPQMVLITSSKKKVFSKNQTLLLYRDGSALVKVVITNLRGDSEAFALVMPDSWAENVKRSLDTGDGVQSL